MAFQTGKDLQRAQLMLTFPSGSYLKENENVHCSITVKTAYSKHTTVLSTLHPFLYIINTTDTSHVELPSLRAARITVLKFNPCKIEGFGSRLKKRPKDFDTQGTRIWQHPF